MLQIQPETLREALNFNLNFRTTDKQHPHIHLRTDCLRIPFANQTTIKVFLICLTSNQIHKAERLSSSPVTSAKDTKLWTLCSILHGLRRVRAQFHRVTGAGKIRGHFSPLSNRQNCVPRQRKRRVSKELYRFYTARKHSPFSRYQVAVKLSCT
jgi:hypothetical protein